MRRLGSEASRLLVGSYSVPLRSLIGADMRHLNSAAFAAPAGTGLLGLAKELRTRCQLVVELKGERVPK